MGLLAASDPRSDVATAWHAKEAVLELYGHQDEALALELVDALSDDLTDTLRPHEVRSLGRTLKRWKHQIAAWDTAQVSNGPTEAANILIERAKRAAFGFTSFRNYRLKSPSTLASPTGHCSRPSPPLRSEGPAISAASEVERDERWVLRSKRAA